MQSTRRFPPPWLIEERQESFIVKDANGQQIAYLYFEDEPLRQMSMKRLSERLRDSMAAPRAQFAYSQFAYSQAVVLIKSNINDAKIERINDAPRG
jgi:hypothetical protein